MAKTAVGLFENVAVAQGVVCDIESKAFPWMKLRTLAEPLELGQSGVMSNPGIDFEVRVSRELVCMGATEAEA